MRTVDWNLALALRDHWQGKEHPDAKLCPMLADLDQLLAFLDEMGAKPGDAILPCPECGDYHRWTLLRELMSFALDLRPASQSKLLLMVNESLESLYEEYGGKEKYKAMRKGAEAYFAKVGADHCYTL